MKKKKRVYHWTEIRTMPFKLDPKMLIEGGMTVEKNCFLKGEGVWHNQCELRQIQFDRAYVVNALSKVLKPLSKISEQNFRDLMDEVMYALHQSKEG